MLLEFKTENYKSFHEETVFSMLAAPKQKDLEYSVHQIKNSGKRFRILSCGILYGPNAGGKTNLIGAMDTFRSIVLRGNIRNCEMTQSENTAACHLELIPNIQDKTMRPVCFSICFTEREIRVFYRLELDLGRFLHKGKRRILCEELRLNDEMIFLREKELSIPDPDKQKFCTVHSSVDDPETLIRMAYDSLNPEELFLTNGFKVLFSNEITEMIVSWFQEKFTVIYHANELSYQREDATELAAVAREFGVAGNRVEYVFDSNHGCYKLLSLFDQDKTALPAELYESLGTLRFLTLFPIIANTLKTGGTLVVDEFDASIHPMALMDIVNIFHNDEINTKHAQLIFDTHNPVFLDANLYRRDEIHFVERDENGNSTTYTLADFGTSGKRAVRKDSDYMKNYFVNRYGAIQDVDFSTIIKEIMKEGTNEKREQKTDE